MTDLVIYFNYLIINFVNTPPIFFNLIIYITIEISLILIVYWSFTFTYA